MRRLLRRLGWLFSWGDARHHRGRALAAMFVQGSVGFGLIAYFRFADGSIAVSISFGLVGGTALVVWGLRQIENPGRRRGRLFHFVYVGVIGAIGLGLILAGAATAEIGLVVAGIPFIGLSIVLIVLKRINREEHYVGHR